ncbi:MAG: glycosyl hydrolase family 65 protein [Phycisphaerales bacterium]
MRITNTLCILLVAAGLVFSADRARSAQTDAVADLMKDVPADFPRFTFDGHAEQADLLTHYLWYHFYHRLGNGLTLFNQEYLSTSDIWLGNACPRGSDKTIQEVHRSMLLGMQMDDEGYVQTHQHFSHAHDHGWPFPLWTQSDNHPDRVKGKTFGWHFQPLDKVPGWVGDGLRHWGRDEYVGEKAASLWELHNVRSLGIEGNRWCLEAQGASPTIITPTGYALDAFNAPYLQLRWTRTGEPLGHALPYVEWLCEGETQFGSDRRVYFAPEKTPLSGDCYHSIMAMYRHPRWTGRIERIRICLAPGESQGRFEIDSFFTAYDTRHTINNPIFILASARYFKWTGDLDFLRRQINRMRMALRYQQTVMGGLEYKHIRNPWPGHDGLPGFVRDANGKATVLGGHGIGNNYWDLMPFGWDDLYATNQYYAATVAMAEIEQAIDDNPGWSVPLGALRMDPRQLREHATEVRKTANTLFWSSDTGRFIASMDKEGHQYDYGYTFLNLDAIWYGLADETHAQSIMDWVSGRRIVASDTSQGTDIYHWRFGPRATTLRNINWYGQGWHGPESIPWGGQVQDGGAVLGFSFYDLWARLQVLGPDDCWQRLLEILAWEKEVHAEGGYRKYYEGGKRGTTLQGGGTAGGLGIDFEFYESSLVPSIVIYGLLGLEAEANGVLSITPRLPANCPRIAVSNLLYHGVRMDISAGRDRLEIVLKDTPPDPVNVRLGPQWAPQTRADLSLPKTGTYGFDKSR